MNMTRKAASSVHMTFIAALVSARLRASSAAEGSLIRRSLKRGLFRSLFVL
jgi:hypothetical protein